jgi:hypothetical protein
MATTRTSHGWLTCSLDRRRVTLEADGKERAIAAVDVVRVPDSWRQCSGGATELARTGRTTAGRVTGMFI